MTPAEALASIRGYAAVNRYEISAHARKRMIERNAQNSDVKHGLMTAVAATWQPLRETWKLSSADLDGDEMILVVAIEDGAIVVTLF